MRTKKVAIITRTSNRPYFLERAIKSVANQTYDNYIHVIINDGAPEAEITSVVEKFDDRIRNNITIFHRKEASGAPDTIFTESVDRVESEYVAIHDDDDTWHPDFLKRTVPLLEAGSAGVVVRTDQVDEEVTSEGIEHRKTAQYMPDLVAVSLYRQCIDNQLTPISFIYQRKSYEAAGKYDTSLPVVGDWEFGIRFLSKFDVEFLDPGFALANYHRRKDKSDNSFLRYNHSHRKYVTFVANRYLREDLEKGKYGLGAIMSDLKYQQDVRHGLVKKIIPKSIIGRLRR